MNDLSHDTDQQDRPGFWAAGRHPVNIGHLVMGLAFLGLAAVWALWGTDAIDDRDLHWLMPVPWIVAGAAGLVATTLSGARRRDRWAGAATDAYSYDPTRDPAHDPAHDLSQEQR